MSSTGGAAAPAAPAAPSFQPTLKVMRLYKPRLFTQGATAGSLLPTALSDAMAAQHEFAMSSALILPDSFGEIFLGNTFSSYISVINQYALELRDVGLTANIQCANERVELQDNRYARTGKMPPPNPTKVLAAGASLDMVVDHPLNQVGNHVLRVGVTYTDPVTGEAKSLRKFYRFGVQNPLVISFKQSRWQNESLVEALIRNVSKLPLYIDSIRFLPGSPFVAEDISQVTGDPNPTGTQTEQDITTAVRNLLSKAAQTLVNPQEELQRVFRLSYDPATDPAAVGAQGSQNLGRLHVGWKTSVGEAGSVQSQPVMRKTEPSRDVVVTIDKIPKHVTVGEPFVAAIRISNTTVRSLQLQIQFRTPDSPTGGGIYCTSVSHQNLELLASKSSVVTHITFLPTAVGLQEIHGVVCVEVRSGQEFPQTEPLETVLVHASAPTSVELLP